MDILGYIKESWRTLERSHRNLASAAADPKSSPPPGGKWAVYVGRNEDLARVEKELRSEMEPGDFSKISLRRLPERALPMHEDGLLYLPKPYVVPGGRFNEMYGWDSFFIQMGLLHDGEISLAQDMADNALYEIREYDKILNANRTYYLTRSQPPFLTGMLLAIYRQTKDREYLAASLGAIENYYRFWTEPPHLTPSTGLSRYFDTGSGPAPEVVASELDRRGRTDYELIKEYFRTHKGNGFNPHPYYDAGKNELTPLFFQNDRAMRESGLDPSGRFGPFGAQTTDYNAVCLNSLLYLMEMQTAEILDILGRPRDAAVWLARAGERAEKVNRLMWDPEQGLYFDYDFVHQHIRRYPSLLTFYPLWVGIASQEQAARVMRNLPRFERSGGLQTSTYRSGDQWDAPFGWAPLQWIAVQGMKRYGYDSDATRVAMRFLSLVLRVFQHRGVILEKYDVVSGRFNLDGELKFGYPTNEVGFGWTNGVFTSLLDALPETQRISLRVATRVH